MSILAKQAYRAFLRSENWKTARAKRLAKDDATCLICGTRDLSNDAHHIHYPEKWDLTKNEHLRTVCRACHDRVHSTMAAHPNLSWSEIKQRIKEGVGPTMPANYHFKLLTIRLAWFIHLNRATNS